MSQWIDRVKNHSVWQVMSTLGAVVDQAQQRASDQDAIDGVERVRAVLTLVGKKDLPGLGEIDFSSSGIKFMCAGLALLLASSVDALSRKRSG